MTIGRHGPLPSPRTSPTPDDAQRLAQARERGAELGVQVCEAGLHVHARGVECSRCLDWHVARHPEDGDALRRLMALRRG